jgi:hypothetical protein
MSECEPYHDKKRTAKASQSQIELDKGKRMSILRRSRLNHSNHSVNAGSKPTSGVSDECNQIRGRFLKWSSGEMSKQSSASKLSSDRSEPKSRRSSFWTR